MTLFAVFATLLVATVAFLLLPPLWQSPKPATAGGNRQAINLAIFRDQLAELEREQAEGMLASADFEQARRELQHRLLEEVQPEEAGTAGAHRPSRMAAIALICLLTLLTLGGYRLLGNPKALDPAFTAPQKPVTADQIEDMVAKLAERLKAQPDDMDGWLMLARSYKALGRYGEAAEAYAKAEKAVAQDAGLLADYAEVLAMEGGQRSLRGKPRQLIDQALKVDAGNPHALLLAGAAAREEGERAKAIAYWEKLLPLVEPGSEIETMLKGSIENLKAGT